MPIDHTSFNVPKREHRTIVMWYLVALQPLGYERLMEPEEGVVGIGADNDPDFWIVADDHMESKANFHVGFTAKDHKSVDAFYEAALKAGGQDNGKPGIREIYHPNYYAAFVLDPVGNNVEVVNHGASHHEK